MPASATETIAAPATPAGSSAVALLRISGPDTKVLAAALAGRVLPARRAVHADYRAVDGALIDDVVLVFFAGPASYTGEDSLEISCHGNTLIAGRILADLQARGCRPALPGEFTQRAFLNGRMDLSQAEAVMDLIRARSERALALAGQQLRGALGRRMAGLVDGLLAVLARVEAYIDFPDEDLPPEDRALVRTGIETLLLESRRLIATNRFGEILRGGIRTVIVGEPNVGKSSLLNRLVGFDRALVSPEPGTTRDFIEESLSVGPHSLRLIDTAGLNKSPKALEEKGIEKSRERLAEADLILLVSEIGLRPELLSEELQQIGRDSRSLIILNKCDTADGSMMVESWFGKSPLLLSAATGSGVEALITALVARADAFQTEVGPDAVAISARHSRALQEAVEALNAALVKLEAADSSELLASDLRAALAAYGEITGRIDNERMLDQLFASFCIGK
jgi:tRNA modification GTPase